MAQKKKVQASRAQVYRRGEGWRFRVKGANGEVIATGEDYKRKADALAAVTALVPEGTPIEVQEAD